MWLIMLLVFVLSLLIFGMGLTILSMIIISLTMRNKQKSLFLIPHRLMRTIYGKTVLGAITGIIVERAITGAITSVTLMRLKYNYRRYGIRLKL